MADASSSGEGIEENPIETAISRGASLSEPAEASISRKRKVIVNHGKYKASREQKNLNSKTSVWDRIRDHPGQHLEYVRGQLKCNACHEILAQKKSTVDRHMKSKKHLAGIARITADRKESRTIFQCLQRQDKQENASGTTLPANLRLFRFEVVETLLLAGIPISKVDILRPLLEKYGQRLTSSSHMNDLIPVVLDKAKEKLKAELNIVREASIIFDGTARLGEALAIVVRYVQQDFRPTQRLLRLEVLAKPLKGNELAQRLMTCMAVNNSFKPDMILAAMRDGASVNGNAIKQLLFFYPKIMDITCFSHTINNVGSKFVFKVLDVFFHHWVNLFAHSYNAKLLWKQKTGKSMSSHSNTRWWSKWEMLKQVSDYFGDVAPFLQENDNLSPQTRRHLLDIFESPQELQLLKLELAVLVDVSVHFVTATYYLEGDGPLIFTCFERLSAVQHAVVVGHFPCLEATAREIAGGNAALQNRLITEAKACVQPGLNFFREKFNIQFISNVRAFKAARFCCPVQVTELRPDARSLEELKNFPFVNDAMVAALATELPLYIAAADGLVCNNEKEKLTWWAAHQDTLPQWSALVRKVLLVQPSSASAERVFSLLATLSAQQEAVLEDYIEASVMVRYNNNQRKL